MGADDYHPGRRVPLPGSGHSDPVERGGTRLDGIRHSRRVSNWTAAALIVGTGAAAVALAHQALPAAAPAAGTAASGTGAGTGSGTPSTPTASGPQVTRSVATTSASGVTTTTTRTINGKTIVTQVRNVPAHSDDR